MVLSVNRFPEPPVALAAGDEIMLENDGRIVTRLTAVPVERKQHIAGLRLLHDKVRILANEVKKTKNNSAKMSKNK